MAPAPEGGGGTTARRPQHTALTLISSIGAEPAEHGIPAINFVVAKPQRPEKSVPNTPSERVFGAWLRLARGLWPRVSKTKRQKSVNQRPD